MRRTPPASPAVEKGVEACDASGPGPVRRARRATGDDAFERLQGPVQALFFQSAFVGPMAKAVSVPRPVPARPIAPPQQLSKEDEAKRDALAGRLFESMVQSAELMNMYLGLRLGYYEALARDGPGTCIDLAARTGTDERYAREWLEAQAASGFLEVANADAAPKTRRFSLPAAHREVLLQKESLAYLGFLPTFAGSIGRMLPKLEQAYRSGEGIAWTTYGDEVRRAQGDQNRPFFRHVFAQQFLAKIPDVHKRLRSNPPARVADIACGVGWSSIAIAQAYPKARVEGFDTDSGAIRLARTHARDQGVSDRVQFSDKDGLKVGSAPGYDLVTICEALHDMSRPVEVLRAVRKSLAPGGAVLVVDENVLEKFTAPAPPLERLFYSFSTLACLANGRAESPSAATGTMMRPDTLARYAREAGLLKAEVLPLPHDFFRFYLLRP